VRELLADLPVLLLSLKVALAAVILDLPPALLLGRLLARRCFPGRALLDTFLALPLVLPPVATGLLILMLVSPTAMPGRLLARFTGLELVFSWPGAALAAGVVAFPLLLRSVIQALESVDPRLGQVARTLGASRMKTFWRVHLPLALPGVAGGIMLAFARALGEFGATMVVAGSIPGRTRTLPLDLYHRFQLGDDAGALRLALLSALLAFAILGVGRLAERRLRARMDA
jgi:molybdate transport system permease protein